MDYKSTGYTVGSLLQSKFIEIQFRQTASSEKYGLPVFKRYPKFCCATGVSSINQLQGVTMDYESNSLYLLKSGIQKFVQEDYQSKIIWSTSPRLYGIPVFKKISKVLLHYQCEQYQLVTGSYYGLRVQQFLFAEKWYTKVRSEGLPVPDFMDYKSNNVWTTSPILYEIPVQDCMDYQSKTVEYGLPVQDSRQNINSEGLLVQVESPGFDALPAQAIPVNYKQFLWITKLYLTAD